MFRCRFPAFCEPAVSDSLCTFRVISHPKPQPPCNEWDKLKFITRIKRHEKSLNQVNEQSIKQNIESIPETVAFEDQLS
jgi:hypothetical protein